MFRRSFLGSLVGIIPAGVFGRRPADVLTATGQCPAKPAGDVSFSEMREALDIPAEMTLNTVTASYRVPNEHADPDDADQVRVELVFRRSQCGWTDRQMIEMAGEKREERLERVTPD